MEQVQTVKPAISNVASLFLASYNSYAVRTDGTFWIWGHSFQPGTGLLASAQHVPVRYDLP